MCFLDTAQVGAFLQGGRDYEGYLVRGFALDEFQWSWRGCGTGNGGAEEVGV